MASVQAQTYQNLVHIVLDNASADATPDIVQRYADARVPVLVSRNTNTLPMAANWNAAVRLTPADAKYFRVLSADDLLDPDFIARTVALAERNPSVVIVGCELRHRGRAEQWGWERDREIFPGREAMQRFFEGTGTIIAHQTLIRRTELDRRQPFFQEGMTADDTDACLDMLRHGDWGFVHEVLATTRDHAGTDTNTSVKRLRLDTCEYLVLLHRYAEAAFGLSTGRAWIARYRRYYLRQLLRWRMGGETEIYERHMATLRRFGVAPNPVQWTEALADWPLARVGVTQVWRGYPWAPA